MNTSASFSKEKHIISSMREFKFRAWDKENNRWFFPTFFRGYKGRIEELLIDMAGEIRMRTIDEFIHDPLFKDRFIINQYTGLKDKNGKEIYEGDIVKYNIDFDRFVAQGIGRIAFMYTPPSYMIIDKEAIEFREGNDLEVIGNIYENPELLK